VEQSGEVRVAVHSGDAELTHGLRQGISELAGKLQEGGYRAEMWHPAGGTDPVSAGSGTHNEMEHSRDGQSQSQSHSGWSHQDGGQENREGSSKPRWVEEMEASLSYTGRFAGVFNGITY
jgi:hypothetical protein